jgi:ABC-2 type transport system permease protein
MTWPLFGKLLQLLMKERMEYRADFLLGAFAQIINFGASYIVIWLFLRKFDTIAGWSWPEIALLYSIGLFTYAIGASFTFVQMRTLEGLVRNGTFDGILTKPVNPYFFFICRGFNLGYIAHVVIAGTVLLWSLSQLEIEWTWYKAMYFVLALVSGGMIQAGVMTLFGACSFILVRTGFLFNLYGRLREFISYPITVFGSFIQILLVFCIPLAFVSFFPSALLLMKPMPLIPEWCAWLSPLVGPLCFWAGYKFWMRCVNRYQGAGG